MSEKASRVPSGDRAPQMMWWGPDFLMCATCEGKAARLTEVAAAAVTACKPHHVVLSVCAATWNRTDTSRATVIKVIFAVQWSLQKSCGGTQAAAAALASVSQSSVF